MKLVLLILLLAFLAGCASHPAEMRAAVPAASMQQAGSFACAPGIRSGDEVKYHRPNPVTKTGDFHYELFGYEPNATSEAMWREREPKRAPASYGNPLYKLARQGQVPFAPEWATVDVTLTGVSGIKELMLLRTDVRDNTDRFVRCIRPSTQTETSVTFTDLPIGGTIHSIVVPYGAMLIPSEEVGIIISARNFRVLDTSGRFEPKLALDPQTVFVSALFRLIPDTKGTGKQECDGDGQVCVGMIVPFEVRTGGPVS